MSETLAKVRTYLGGAFGNCEEARKAGARMCGNFSKKIKIREKRQSAVNVNVKFGNFLIFTVAH